MKLMTDENLYNIFTWQYMVVAVSAIFNLMHSFVQTPSIAAWVRSTLPRIAKKSVAHAPIIRAEVVYARSFTRLCVP